MDVKTLEVRVRDAYARHGGVTVQYCLWCNEPLTDEEKALHLEACQKCEPIEAAA